MKNSAYSGTPLIKKLGLSQNMKVKLINIPENYFELLENDLSGMVFSDSDLDFVHCFVTSLDALEHYLIAIRSEIKQDGAIWISWPKKSSKILSNVNEDLIRASAIKNGLVDVKVCAIDNDWSALKLVIPLKYRK